uniref:Odorant receptor n=1 Tax=Yemma signatus TaxID=300820 RepID=A0A385H661_9HEMI|nr:odorant receptor [Yemma signatus]
MKTQEREDNDFVYDFTSHRILWMFALVHKSPLFRLANYGYLGILFGLHGYFLILAVVTISTIQIKELAVAASLFVWIALVNVGLLVSRYSSNGCLEDALGQFQSGVFSYPTREGEDPRGAVTRRVLQVRRVVSYFNKFCYFSGSLNTYFIPFLAYLKMNPSTVDLSQFPLNPYLPLPLVTPFRTDNLPGYLAALFFESLFMAILWITYMGHQEIFVSVSLQLCGQLELLSESLESLESRARSLLHLPPELPSDEELYSRPDFQRAMYICFRENVLHHRAIIRLYNQVLPYMESATFFIVFGFSFLMAVETFIYLQNPQENVPMLFFLASDLVGLLVMMSAGQMLGDKSLELANVLYSTPWTSCDSKFKSMLLIELIRSQQPLVVKARFFSVEVNLETFADIVSAGYKMVNVLR